MPDAGPWSRRGAPRSPCCAVPRRSRAACGSARWVWCHANAIPVHRHRYALPCPAGWPPVQRAAPHDT